MFDKRCNLYCYFGDCYLLQPPTPIPPKPGSFNHWPCGHLGSKALPSEAGPLSSDLCLIGSTPTASYEEEELPPDPSEETLTIEARFQPLLPESMTKSKDGFLGVSWGGSGRGLRRGRTRDGGTVCASSPPENGLSVLISPSFLRLSSALCAPSVPGPDPTAQAPCLVGELGGISLSL